MSHATDADKDTGGAKTWAGDNQGHPDDSSEHLQHQGYAEAEAMQGMPFNTAEMGPGGAGKNVGKNEGA